MYSVEHMSIRAISRALGISRQTVTKYAEGNVQPGQREPYSRLPTVISPEVQEFIQRCIDEDTVAPHKQHHTARRIFERLVDELDFTGAESTIRHMVHGMRQKAQKAFVKLVFDPGEAMQIDWGTFQAYLQGEPVRLYYFCARLCYSCAPFVMYFRRQNTEAFLEAQVHAFEFFGGVPRRVIFDNAKVAVKSGYGKTAIAQDKYKALAAHYCFEMDFCNPASGNEKGLVENLVGWTRRNIFVPVPHVTSLKDLNQHVLTRCRTYIEKHSIASRKQSVHELLQMEKASLIRLPNGPFDASFSLPCRVDAFSTIRFDGCRYSVPIAYVGKTVSVKGFAEEVQIYENGRLLTVHERCYTRNSEILKLDHFLPILSRKPGSLCNASVIKKTLSEAMQEWLKCQKLTGQQLFKLLQDISVFGEPYVWNRRNGYIEAETQPRPVTEEIKVQSVDLCEYDHLFLPEGGESACQRIQA